MKNKIELPEEAYSDDLLVAAKAQRKALDASHILVHGLREDGTCDCGKEDCQSPGKHPIAEHFPKGALSATRDPMKLRRALSDYPNANLAMTTDGLTVVDVDGPEGQAEVEALSLPKTLMVKTRRGYHRIYSGELEGGSFKANQIDVLTGPSRYVLTPPSRTVEGKRYKYSRLGSTVIAPVVNAITKLKGTTHGKPTKREKAWVISKGERNDVLFKLACSLRRRIGSSVLVQRLVEEVNATACAEPLSQSEVEAICNSSERYDTKEQDGALFGPVIDRDPALMEWLYFPYIPRFGLTIFAGNPGRGKSLMLAEFIAIVTTGKVWPMTTERAKVGKVLLLSAEDNWKRQTLPRLIAAGANIDNVYVMYRVRALDADVLDEMAQKIEEWRPDLVVIDTLTAYMGGKRDMNRQNEVGEFLVRLTEIAESVGCAIVGVAHLNKQGNEHPLYRIVGSIGFVASIRSALFLGGDPDDPHSDRVALAHGKANGMSLGPTILFKQIGGGRESVPTMEAVGFSDHDAVAVCAIMKRPVGRPKSESEEAAAFIKEFLDHEPRKWENVLIAAEARSIASNATLSAVRTELAKAGEIQQVGNGKNAKWQLVISKEAAEDVE
jgi:AAA domain/Bifunctional DNA primase/polymerase, N-terminal/Primase C terminal 1 (PriCT-1)